MIKHFYFKYWKAAQIKAELDEVHGESAPSLKTVYFYINEFERGRTKTKDEARSECLLEVTTLNMVEKIHHMVMKDRRIKVREISKAVGISTERVLHEKLVEVREVCARWVSRLLTSDQKRDRKDVSAQCLAKFNRNPQDFLCRFVIVDETKIHQCIPESKEQSKQWVLPGESAPKNSRKKKYGHCSDSVLL